MKIAVLADRASLDAIVPDTFETSPALLVVESDTNEICDSVAGPDVPAYIKKILEYDCEAVVCGPHITKESFNPIANASITRYDGAGYVVSEAVRLSVYNRIPIIPDFEGGTGCDSGTHSCEEGGCGIED